MKLNKQNSEGEQMFGNIAGLVVFRLAFGENGEDNTGRSRDLVALIHLAPRRLVLNNF